MPILPAPYSTILIAIFLMLATGTALYAWSLSSVGSRKRRQLVEWAQEHRPDAWLAVPPTALSNPTGELDFLRHNGLADDAEFVERYQETAHYRLVQFVLLAMSVFDFGLVLAGTYFWGLEW